MEKQHVALTKCFYCGKDGDLILATQYRRNQKGGYEPTKDLSPLHGKADPRYPCEECEKHMKMGVILCETRDGENGNEPFRTGKQWVITEEACDRLFDGIDTKGRRFFFIEESTAHKIGLHEIPIK